MYQDYIKERFERCLDLYLCPRSRKKRINIDPETLVPQLPKPADLQPFPTTMCLEYTGHTAKVRFCLALLHFSIPANLISHDCVAEHRESGDGPLPQKLICALNHQVTTLSPDTSGQWIASGSADGTVRIWEVIKQDDAIYRCPSALLKLCPAGFFRAMYGFVEI